MQEVLRPFLLVCESRNPRLVASALASLHKLLSHDAVSAEGRQRVIHTLNQVRRLPAVPSAPRSMWGRGAKALHPRRVLRAAAAQAAAPRMGCASVAELCRARTG
jgi:hypothetical protein